MNNEMRLYIFVFGLILFSSLEFFFSYRKRSLTRKDRWPHNLMIIFIGSLLVKMILPGGLGLISHYSEKVNLGLFSIFDIPWVLEVGLGILILDFSIYLQHVIFHKSDFLWRFHRVHHSDVDLDATSALRFHPIEILISLAYKSVWILFFGFSLETILAFEILLNFMAMFNHSNLYLPKRIELFLRFFIVTPQMHLIHHSIEQYESKTNYGFNFSFWDRLFKTYTESFKSNAIIGNKRFRKREDHGLVAILKQPFE